MPPRKPRAARKPPAVVVAASAPIAPRPDRLALIAARATAVARPLDVEPVDLDEPEESELPDA